ncbi:hypothetical protein [Rhodococcus sp. 1139]|uniref:hypothetical protein n=1 Tax=Rhodococcus sp. 1139 TaxID=1833762 RepID=UPI000872534B|nr:hypothetical protein [Rhodococcus sp. 1139]OFE09221.1 hypothetical protein A5N83_08445 [Rhodococcus sp. 1139]
MAKVQNATTWVNKALHYVEESVHANEVDKDVDRANVFAAQALVFATLATTGIQIASNVPAEGTVELPSRR